MTESYDIGPFICGHCGNSVRFKVIFEDFSQLQTHTYEIEALLGTMEDSTTRGWIYRLLLCSACKQITFERLFSVDGEPEESQFLFPQPFDIPDGLPEKVGKEYAAALKERLRNPNGYASLLGRTLDAICSDRGISTKYENGKPKFLTARLEELIQKEGLVPVGGIVNLRNVAAHADLGNLLAEDIPLLEALVRYILDHLYIVPAINQKALETNRARRKKT